LFIRRNLRIRNTIWGNWFSVHLFNIFSGLDGNFLIWRH
jgi:hypothetical protein